MAVTTFHGGYRLTAAGDTIPGGLHRITTIVCANSGVAGESGNYTFKDADGDIIMVVPVWGDLNLASAVEVVPVNTDIKGLEIDALPTNGSVTVFVK